MIKCWMLFWVPVLLIAKPIEVPKKLYKGMSDLSAHPGDAPLISDLTFRSICDHVIDAWTDSFDPKNVRQGDTIYLNLWYIDWFEEKVHDQIKHPYILVSCDVRGWLPEINLTKLLYDPKLAAWFCRNMIFTSHPKLFQIPMGQTDRFFGYHYLPKLKELIEQKPFPKTHLLYMNHFPRNHGDRRNIIKLFENEPYCFSRNHSNMPYITIPKEQYYEELAHSTFVVSPFGLESDCIRTWEALTLDCIPIVEHSFLDAMFEDMPVLLIHDWREINEPFLQQKYTELKDKKRDKVYFEYWRNQIQETQKKIRNNDLSDSKIDATQWSESLLQDLIEILEEEKHPYLIYKGFLSSSHSLQILEKASFITDLYLYDPWFCLTIGNGHTFHRSFDLFINYLEDDSLFEETEKITLISDQEFYQDFANFNPFATSPAPILLDLSYYQYSLLTHFDILRHQLLKDLDHLYQRMLPNGLLIGNRTDHRYISEVLDQFSKKHSVQIHRKGNFWFFRKLTVP